MSDLTRRGFIYGTATLAAYGLLLGVQRACLSALADETSSDDDPGPVTVVRFSDDGARLGKATLPKVRKSKAEWKKQLSPLGTIMLCDQCVARVARGALTVQRGCEANEPRR